MNCEDVTGKVRLYTETTDVGRYIGDGRDKSAPTEGVPCNPDWGLTVGNGKTVPGMAVGWLLYGMVGDAYT